MSRHHHHHHEDDGYEYERRPSYYHPRHRRHNPVDPEEGDGSCWITPEGYILLRYEGHYGCLEDEGLDGNYDRAFNMGWIRVGIYAGSDPSVRFRSKCVDYRSLVFLERILGKLFAFDGDFWFEDSSLPYPDNMLHEPKDIRAKVKKLLLDKAPAVPIEEDMMQMEMEV